MKQEESLSQIVSVIKYYCDDCGIQLHRNMACSVAKCEICGKDLCDKCVGHEDQDTGDYRTVYCSSCWNIGKPYRDKIKILESEIDQLNDEWINKCIKHKN